jgi:branched-chain amino acid transport system substrate-binding protein
VNLQQGYEHLRFPAPALQNMYIPVGYIEEIPTEANKDFIDRWHAVWPDEPYINQPARCAYVAVQIMAKAWALAGTTETDAVISALESGIGFDAPEGPVLLDPATHHLSMVIRMAQIDDQHKVSWVHDFGSIETWWLRSLGVNLVAKNDAKQYLPWDDPRYAKYKTK